ncbi:hypothetical protein [Thalassolituus sp.]|jgi:hypothetical protein|uniref:hypothetical protein n=1 Tax=Thalassolituus sp. TaxID=2030822 RepID=UPI002A835E4D|nr:hypothetical protein [Thalassolituus sp.]
MKPLILTILLLFSCFGLTQPAFGPNMAASVLQQGFAGERLFWTPMRLPMQVERASTSRDAVTLAALLRHQMVARDEMMHMEDMGAGKKRVVLTWDYRALNDEDPEGFYYGIRRVKEIMSLSEPQQQGGDTYAEAVVAWYVDDIESWVRDPAFRAARTLRRSQESFQKPFETRVIFKHENGRWKIWRPENEFANY